MAKDTTAAPGPRKPVGSDYTEDRKTEPGEPAFEKAPPEACAIRPLAVKLRGLDVVKGEIQGTRDHCEVIARKYQAFFGPLCEWVELEGDKL